MKRLLILLFTAGLTMGAAAQPRIGGFKGGGVSVVRPRVTVVAPYASMAPYYGYGLGYGLGFRYSPFYDPFYYPRQARPSQLDLQIEDIKNDYKYKIDNVKDDKTLARDERRQKIRDLKHEREDEIIEVKKSYYKNDNHRNVQ